VLGNSFFSFVAFFSVNLGVINLLPFPALDGSNIILDAPDENREALLQYLQAAGRFDPSADANWQIVPVAGVKMRFLSGAGGIAHLSRAPQVRLVKDNGDGSALFELAH
jgi:2',3'-cyclic-nucleotide 2'-phosphodiesterase/3'-nucleotidase